MFLNIVCEIFGNIEIYWKKNIYQVNLNENDRWSEPKMYQTWPERLILTEYNEL